MGKNLKKNVIKLLLVRCMSNQASNSVFLIKKEKCGFCSR